MEIRRITVKATEIRLLRKSAMTRIVLDDEYDEDEVDEEDESEKEDKAEEEDRSKSSSSDDMDNDGDNDTTDNETENPDEEEDETEPQYIEGYASVFNSDSEDLGGFIERVSPNAFNCSLKNATDGLTNIYAFWSHDPSQPLGSTRGGKLELKADKTGLKFRLSAARLNPMQLDAVKDGEMRMSFGFQVNNDSWEQMPNGEYIRTLNDVDLFEVSPVVMPAYPDTSAALRAKGELTEAQRSLEAFKSSQDKNDNKYNSNRAALLLRASKIMERLISHKLK